MPFKEISEETIFNQLLASKAEEDYSFIDDDVIKKVKALPVLQWKDKQSKKEKRTVPEHDDKEDKQEQRSALQELLRRQKQKTKA